MRSVLPVKDFVLRPDQKAVVDRILKAFETKDIVILQAPTGSGKSIIGRSITTAFHSSYVLTPTKALQDQYYEDFSADDFRLLKGKANYFCNLDDEQRKKKVSVDEQFCQGSGPEAKEQLAECKDAEICPYYTARDAAVRSPCTLMNFMGYITWMIYGKRMENPIFFHRSLHVVDEAHRIEDCVSEALSIKIRENRLVKLLEHRARDLPDMDEKGTHESVLQYLCKVKPVVVARLEDHGWSEDPEKRKRPRTVLDTLEFKNNVEPLLSLLEKIEYVQKEGVDNYALGYGYEESKGTKRGGPYVFSKPLQVKTFIKDEILGGKTLLMSATLPMTETWAKDLGLTDYEIIDMDSCFPVEKRPIWFTPVGSMRSGGAERLLYQAAEKITQIVEKFPKAKGIIHTPSYAYNKLLQEQLPDESRLLWCLSGEDSEKQLAKHYHTKKHTILVSPAMREGVDLKNDLSRFQIIVKAPFDSLGDPAIKKKSQRNRGWYNMRTLTNFLQMYGRSIRTPEDHARTYILDEDLKDFLNLNQKHIPKYVLEAIHW